jgi:hypothetical protein
MPIGRFAQPTVIAPAPDQVGARASMTLVVDITILHLANADTSRFTVADKRKRNRATCAPIIRTCDHDRRQYHHPYIWQVMFPINYNRPNCPMRRGSSDNLDAIDRAQETPWRRWHCRRGPAHRPTGLADTTEPTKTH